MATLTFAEPVITEDSLNEAKGIQMDELSCSVLMKSFLKKMMSYREGFRHTASSICMLLVCILHLTNAIYTQYISKFAAE